MTLRTYQPPPSASSVQDAQSLIGFVGQATRTIAEIEADLARDIAALTRAADAKAAPVKNALEDAQAKVEVWARTHPESARLLGVGDQVVDPLEAQLAAVLMATARPMSVRQRKLLAAMQATGAVLRRRDGQKTYWMVYPANTPDEDRYGPRFMNTNQVHDLHMRFLDAHDAASGELLLGVSAFTDRLLEFRIKPDVVLP